MTEKEAYDLLGLRPGASDDAVKKAYRHIIQKVHPDKGGTAALFRQVREAYEFLTNKKKGTSQGSSGSANAEYTDGAEERRKREEERRRKTEEQRRRSEEAQRKRREEERLEKWRAHGRNREKLYDRRLNLKNKRKEFKEGLRDYFVSSILSLCIFFFVFSACLFIVLDAIDDYISLIIFVLPFFLLVLFFLFIILSVYVIFL